MNRAAQESAPRPPLMPPVLLLLGVIAMGLLDRFAPFARVAPPGLRWVGIAIAVAGLALGGWVTILFRRAETAIRPGEPPSRLVDTGPFRFTRNPIYLGMAIMLAGFAIYLGSASPWIVPPIFVALIDRTVIPIEEAVLRANLGAEYESYLRRVRRWI